MRNTKKTTILWIVLTFFMWAAFVPKQVAFGESNLRWHWFSALSLKNDWRILGEWLMLFSKAENLERNCTM